MLSQDTTIINRLGLHARASAKLVQTASRFQSRVSLIRNGKRVDAKSIMAVMMLAASQGSPIQVETEGEDEAQALQALLDLIADRFGEGE